jgi:hypothetical protein
MAGSDVFAPTVCRAKVEITQTGASEGATIDWQELECTGTVAGVSPSALAMYVRGLYDVSGHALRELEIRGGLPLDGSRLSIDKARARGWLTDLSAEPYRVWPNLTATITERPARDTYGTIVETADGTAFVQAFVEGFSVVTELWVPPGVTDIRRRFALSRGKTNFRHKTENGTTKLDYWSPMSIPGVANVPPDVVTSRAAFANGVEVLVARKAIESAVWSLGVGGLPPREASSRAKPPTGSGPGAAGGVGSRPRR